MLHLAGKFHNFEKNSYYGQVFFEMTSIRVDFSKFQPQLNIIWRLRLRYKTTKYFHYFLEISKSNSDETFAIHVIA